MKTEPDEWMRRVLKRYSAKDRERLINEQEQSGLTQVAFCRHRRINIGTFRGWAKKKRQEERPAFAEVEMSAPETSAVEIVFPNGALVRIRQQGEAAELVSFIRGVAGC